MTDVPPSPPPDEAGERPLEFLGRLDVALPGDFVHRVRRRIERRLLAGELLWLAVTGPLAVFLELLRLPFQWLGRSERR